MVDNGRSFIVPSLHVIIRSPFYTGKNMQKIIVGDGRSFSALHIIYYQRSLIVVVCNDLENDLKVIN